jgi:hypothetical protein
MFICHNFYRSYLCHQLLVFTTQVFRFISDALYSFAAAIIWSATGVASIMEQVLAELNGQRVKFLLSFYVFGHTTYVGKNTVS